MKKAEVANDLACFRNGVRKLWCGKHSGEEEVLVTCNPTSSNIMNDYVFLSRSCVITYTRWLLWMTSLFFGRVKIYQAQNNLYFLYGVLNIMTNAYGWPILMNTKDRKVCPVSTRSQLWKIESASSAHRWIRNDKKIILI